MTNIKLQLPKTLRNIKLRDFQKYSNIIESNPDADRDFLEIKIMEIFCGLKYKDISSLPVGIFDDATSWMMSMFENKTPLVKRFNMIGSDGVEVEFGFIPNLDKITMGEYIDLNNYFGSDTDLHKAMAVLYRPIHPSYKDKDSYRIGSYEGTSTHSDIMKDMPLDIALGARVFFLRLGTKLSTLTMSYLQSQIQEETILSEEEKKDLIANMNGIKNYTLLQAEKHLELMRLL
tara:strand:+ start:839 stop:1534 length:696 start_codon:yes stop_codon:yes gene_type:complete